MKQFFEEKYLLRLKDKNVLDSEHDDIFYHESFNLNLHIFLYIISLHLAHIFKIIQDVFIVWNMYLLMR